MAEPLKNSFGPDIPGVIGDMVSAVHPDFDRAGFTAAALEGYEELELTPRARQIAAALASYLPADRAEALRIIVDALGPEIAAAELTGMEPFRYLPFVFFVAAAGLDHFEESMTAQYELTKRFTAEFSIRAFLDRYPDATLARLREWAADGNVHVRRLVSEGTRPRLPWAPRLRRFQDDPTPVLELLELLKDDPAEYVRRSVANNLNDISKDHPDLASEVAARWAGDAGPARRKLIRHGLRGLVKAGHPGALAVLGYTSDSPVELSAVTIEPTEVAIGEKVRISAEVLNPDAVDHGALLDLIVHFVKSKGATSPKVFKGGERNLGPGESATVTKTISLAQHSTRTHHPGLHRIEIQLNGVVHPGGEFTVV